MKVTTIGCGNAFSNKSFNQSFVVEEGSEKMLIDCGMQTPQALAAAGFNIKDITDIYISHLHADHIGGLEYAAFLRYDWAKHPRSYTEGNYAPRLIGNVQLLKDAWDKSLRGGLESMEGFVATLETFFEPIPVQPNQPIFWAGWRIDLIQQIHIMSGSIITPSFGIIFSKEGHKSIYFVTDSQHCSPRQMEEYYKKADIILQDSECTGVNFKFTEGTPVWNASWDNGDGTATLYADKTTDYFNDIELIELSARGFTAKPWECFKFGSGVHANYAQLAGYDSANSVKLKAEIKAKMWLSHYQDFVLEGKDMYGNPVDWDAKAKEDGFAGFVKVGQVFEL